MLWGFFCDDHGQQLVLEGAVDHPTMRPWSLYDFGAAPRPGDAVFENGSYAWWTDEDWKVRFFRPVASLALMLDHAAFGRWAPGYHASGLAWFALLLVLAHALYRALGLGPGTALLATLFVAVEDGGVFPVGWTANRNTLVEAVFVVLALLCVARPKRVGAGSVALALAAACAAALAKESGVAAFPLVAVVLLWRAFYPGGARATSGDAPAERGGAAETSVGAAETSVGAAETSVGAAETGVGAALAIDRAARAVDGAAALRPAASRRLAMGGAAAALALAGAYVAFLLTSGYGATCAFYPTPWDAPGAVLRNAALLSAIAPLSMAGPIGPDVLSFQRELGDAFLPFAIPFAIAWLAGAALLAVRAPRWLPFIAIAVVTLLPQAGAPPAARLLFVPMIGFAPLLALLVVRWRAAGGRRRSGATAILVSAIGLSVLASLVAALSFLTLTRTVRAGIVAAEVPPPDDAGPQGYREAIVLNAPTEFLMLVPVTTWTFETGDRGVRFWPLQCGRRALEWTRVDATTFDLRTPGPAFGTGPVERVLLAREPDVAAGRVWRTALFDVEALEPSPVRAVRVRLPAPLEDPSYAFLAWSEGGLRRVAPPAVGETVEFAALEPLLPMMP
jgi:hypothetical protein